MRSYTIDDWCKLRRVSRPMFYKLKRLGQAPRTYNVGRSVYISEAADAEWLAARETAAKVAA